VNIAKEIISRLRYGLTTQSFVSLLRRFGLYIAPFYLHQEGMFGQEWQASNHTLNEYDFGFLGPEDMNEVANSERKVSEKELLARLDAGKKCFAAKYHGQLAAYTWCDFESCHDEFYKFKLKENEVYLFGAHTLTPFRGKNLAPYLRFKCYKALEALGRNNFYSITHYFNKPSIRFKKKLHAKSLMLGFYVGILKKWSWSWKIKDYHYPN
jgi:hypothetical protein